MSRHILSLLLLALSVLRPTPASSQWASQTNVLSPGWNAVYLEVQPEPRECDAQFATVPIDSVWAWSRRSSSVQYIDTPSDLVPSSPDWQVYFPPQNEASAATTLFALQGGQSYLIKVSTNSLPVRWILRGKPVTRKIDWVTDSFNLVGFSLDRTTPPSFQAFFAPSVAHRTAPYRLNPAGYWEQLANPDSIQMRSGEAFWTWCSGISDYEGPIQVTTERRAGLDFGRDLVELRLRMRNGSTANKSILLRLVSSQAPVSASFPFLAGPVPISYWSSATNQFGWRNLTTQLRSNVPPGSTWELRLAVRRRDMARLPNLPPGFTEARYQSLVQVTDEAGSSRYLVPVTADGLQTPSSNLLGAFGAAALTPPEANGRTGLWVGTVSITKVSQPSNLASPFTPLATSSTLQFRLILHVASDGRVRLLQKVWQVFRPGTYQPVTNGPPGQTIEHSGRYVLLTEDSLLAQYSGATLRDGQPVMRRYSSVGFGLRQPLVMSQAGDFGEGGSTCLGVVATDFNDGLNPFVHRFHPSHDNRSEVGQSLPEGKESFTVTRQIQLEFTDTDPGAVPLPSWGDNQLGGIYRETITGLHGRPISIEGTFRTYLAARIGVLNIPE